MAYKLYINLNFQLQSKSNDKIFGFTFINLFLHNRLELLLGQLYW